MILMFGLTARTVFGSVRKTGLRKVLCDCHGSTVRVNGQAAQTIPMSPPPPDLEVVDTIDGRKSLPSHGRIQVPYLRTKLQKPDHEFTPESNPDVKRRIDELARYVERPQQK